MPVKQEFVYTQESGKKLPTLHEWVDTLSGEDQLNFRLAEKRQLTLRQQAIEQAQLTVVKKTSDDVTALDNYVWSDEAKNKPVEKRKKWDRVWLQYWSRYLKETGAQFEIIEKPID